MALKIHFEQFRNNQIKKLSKFTLGNSESTRVIDDFF